MTDPSIKQDSSTSFVRGFSSGVFHLAISAPYILFIMRADSFLDSAVLRSRQEQHLEKKGVNSCATRGKLGATQGKRDEVDHAGE